MPVRAADAQRGSHRNAGLECEIALSSRVRLHADRILHGVLWKRLFNVGFAGGAMSPPRAVARLRGINDEAKRIVRNPEFFRLRHAWRFDEPANCIFVI